MKNKYKKYTNSYMKYLRFLHTEYAKNQKLKELLHRGYFDLWNHWDQDDPKTRRESRMLSHYYDHMLGILF